jgi:peptidoglycan/LPS O-acetylase OafA/YrhL
MAEAQKNKDCLNTIRLLGAFQVFYYHTITHLHISMPDGVTKSILFIMGVPVFFFLSGYLNWFSSSRSNSVTEYYKKRFLRIYPELWVAVIIEILSIIVLYGKSINWPLLGTFAITQGTFLQFWTPDFLRGYGCGCPNGALWTICMIIQFYVIAYPLQRWLRDKSLRIWLLVLIISIVVGATSNFFVTLMPMIIGKLYGQLIFRYFWLFFIGLFVGKYAEQVLPFVKRYFLWLLITSGIVWLTGIDYNAGLYGIIRSTLFCFGALGLAYACPRLNIKTDISYAVYIYHMIVVNAFIQLGLTGSKQYLFATITAVLLISLVSTKTIGQLSQNWKRRYTNSSL